MPIQASIEVHPKSPLHISVRVLLFSLVQYPCFTSTQGCMIKKMFTNFALGTHLMRQHELLFLITPLSMNTLYKKLVRSMHKSDDTTRSSLQTIVVYRMWY